MSEAIAPSLDPSGRGPFIWHVPHQRNAFFSGREEELADLRKSLAAHDSVRHVQAVWGLAGVGKTQLALEYVYRFSKEYKIVWWLSAEEPSNLALSYAKLATRLGMEVPEGAPLDDIRLALRKALGKQKDWLLIFDNAASIEEVRQYVPPERTGHAIITSRNPNWEPIARPLPLRPMKRVESVDFLLKRTGKKKVDGAVGALAQALGDLPLALDQAAACISSTQADFTGYLHNFEAYWAELLHDVRPTGDYPDSVHMTWELACRQLQEENTQASYLMNLLAYLGSDAVPRELLRGAEGLPDVLTDLVQTESGLEEAIGTLARYALLRDDGNSTSMHKLVGNLVRDRLPEDEKRQWSDAAVKLLAGVYKFDSQELTSWDACAALLPHALAAAFHAEANRVAPRATVDVLENAGRYLLKRAQFGEAKSVFERAMALASSFYGDTHPRVSAVANNLGRLHRQLGNVAEARECFERSLAIDQEVYGETDPRSAAVYNNFGIALHATGEREKAKLQFEWALQVFENTYGSDHAKIASVANNLGYVLKGTGDLDGAKNHFDRAMDVAKMTYGDNHPIVASILTNLGIVARLQGDVAAAKSLFERALEIHENVQGENHPSVARDLAHLGVALQELGLRDAALERFERALKIDRAIYGETHPTIAVRLCQMGRLMMEMDNEPAANRCFSRARAIRKVAEPDVDV